MRKRVFCMSFILTFITLGVFSQEKAVLTVGNQSKIDSIKQSYIKNGMPAEMAERRALAVFESQNKVSTRSIGRNTLPPANSIWVNRDPDNLANPHPVYNTASAEDLVKKVLLSDPKAEERISNVIYTGEPLTSPDRALAYFENGNEDEEIFGISKGLILGTYKVMEAEGPNETSGGLGGGFSVTGDPHLTSIATSSVETGAILQFDFQPYITEATFDFIFASEEYPEYSNADVNDAFGFFVFEQNDPTNFVNIALFPDDSPVTINNSNWGRWYGSNTQAAFSEPQTGSPPTGAVNPQWHRPNYDNSEIMEYDGRTVKLQAVAKNLDPSKIYTLKLAICNISDGILGSAVFLSNLDLGSAGIDFTSPYLSGHRANSTFHGMAADYSSISGGVKDYVESLIGNDPDFGPSSLDKYKGFFYTDCKYVNELSFEGLGENLVLSMCGNDKFGEYATIDSLFLDGKKVEYCYEGGTGKEKSILDYVWGVDSIRRSDATVEEGVLYFYMNSLPKELNSKPFGVSSFVYVGGAKGLGDTAVFVGFSRIDTDIKYRPVMGNIYDGNLQLGLEGGSKYLRWANVSGLDCDAEYSDKCHWRYLRDTITGEELPFTNWELLKLYNGDDRVPIIMQEPGSCYADTVWIGGGAGIVNIQRYISIPYMPGVETSYAPGKHYVPGRKDFSFTAKFAGEPLTVLATGFYSNTVLNLDETAEKMEDGSYQYTIRQVLEPWTIEFVPRLNSGEVSNETFAPQPVWSAGGTLYVNTQGKNVVSIYTLTGTLHKQIEVNNSVSIQLPKGFYVVSVAGNQYKVVIR